MYSSSINSSSSSSSSSASHINRYHNNHYITTTRYPSQHRPPPPPYTTHPPTHPPTYISTYTHTHTYTHTYTHIHTYTHVHTYIHTHTHTRILILGLTYTSCSNCDSSYFYVYSLCMNPLESIYTHTPHPLTTLTLSQPSHLLPTLYHLTIPTPYPPPPFFHHHSSYPFNYSYHSSLGIHHRWVISWISIRSMLQELRLTVLGICLATGGLG